MTSFIDSGTAKLRIEEAATKKQVSWLFTAPGLFQSCAIFEGFKMEILLGVSTPSRYGRLSGVVVISIFFLSPYPLSPVSRPIRHP